VGHTLGSAICSQTAQCLRLILVLQNITFFDKFNQMESAEFFFIVGTCTGITFAHTKLVWVRGLELSVQQFLAGVKRS
jgi:hypothetical protein